MLHPGAHAALLSPTHTGTFTLGRVPLDRFTAVLAAMGVDPPPSDDTVSAIYALSGGNLALARQYVDRFAGEETVALLGATDADDFVDRLLSARIRTLGPIGQQAVALLQIAAVLGLTFRRHDVVCAADGEPSQTSRLLRYCRDEGVLEVADDVCRFVHDVYRRHFLSSAGLDKAGIHERLDECLRTLRPSEYELRCVNALDAERRRDAGALGVHAALQRERDGGRWEQLPRQIVGAIDAAALRPVIVGLTKAFEHLKAYRFADCLAVLDQLPHRVMTKALAAEADCLRSMCLMSTRSEDDRARGRAILQAWDGFEVEEPEIGLRLMLLLLYGKTHLRDKSEALVQEGRIRQVLMDRASYDPAAQDVYYTLGRSAASLYSPDVAVIRTAEAVRHFAPAEDASLIRRPLEYYRCAVNYGANLVCNARYAEAHTVHRNLQRLVDGYALDTFPRLDYPLMNGLLARYRLAAVTADEAVEQQREIAALSPDSDPFYIRNALAVYLTLAGAPGEGLEVWDGLDRELLRSRRDPEPSMVYLIRANRAAARFVAGDTERARAEWNELAAVVDRIAYVTRDYLVRRHELLSAAMAEDVTLAGREWDEQLIDRLEFGRLCCFRGSLRAERG